jgi:hypothetical protein
MTNLPLVLVSAFFNPFPSIKLTSFHGSIFSISWNELLPDSRIEKKIHIENSYFSLL